MTRQAEESALKVDDSSDTLSPTLNAPTATAPAAEPAADSKAGAPAAAAPAGSVPAVGGGTSTPALASHS
jgi:hypothetical protein